MQRRKTVNVPIGKVWVGSDYPIRVQSMTNTDTADVAATVAQILALAEAGSEIVRVTVNTVEAARGVVAIRETLNKKNCSVPLVGDFHFNGDRLLKEVSDCSLALAKYRINPGNVGKGAAGDRKFAYMIEKAIEHDKAVRIGVNWGSLDQKLVQQMIDDNNARHQPLPLEAVIEEALVTSALSSAQRAMDLGLKKERLILSCKVSEVMTLVRVYERLASLCDFPLHLGLTEAGIGEKGIVASSAALAIVLSKGIGDTIRISLTPKPGEARAKEVEVAQELLQSMGLHYFSPLVTSCPGCGRTTSSLFQEMALNIQDYIRARMPYWRVHYPGVEAMSIAVMGCVVNGPGESKRADIGISLPGNGESPTAPVYIDGQRQTTLKGDNLVPSFIAILEDYVKNRFGPEGSVAPSKKNSSFEIKLEK